MCYMLLLSTSSSEDLSVHNCDLIHFEKDASEHAPSNALRYSNKWFVGSRSGCSCSFRQLYSIELGFEEPVDWYKEDQDDIAATLLFVKIVKSLLTKGEGVDCIDLWDDILDQPEEASIPVLEVNFEKIGETEFRFFENHHFNFTLTTS